jgi:predicted ribonuclease toxin of YeeF-YezG toxin-antitoxin module
VPTFSAVLLETKLATIELYTGSTVTQAVSEGNYSFDSTALRARKAFVLDVVDGAELIRIHAPYGIVTEVGDLVYANGEAVGYEVTVSADRDPTLGYNFKSWATALKT